MPTLQLSHLGLCVADLERSFHFYTDLFGFKEDSTRPRISLQGGMAAQLLEIPEVSLTAVYLLRDGLCLELLHYPTPGAEGDAAPRPMNALGFTHLSFNVDSIDEILPRVVAAGGRVIDASRIPVAVFVTDPDGTRIELVQTHT
jgi:catechol 2,3-dioxygenase-like lactoylglutathione lyase family enzyme